ncbi:MAG: hypothetical protein K2J70_01105, partial [Muribaculaceae bacterium]|nr:hypothetical protein [Muribaculaceae bacterium]
GDFIALDMLKAHLQTAGNSVVIIDSPRGWIAALADAIPEGLVFYGKRNAILVNRPGMMKVAYRIIL